LTGRRRGCRVFSLSVPRDQSWNPGLEVPQATAGGSGPFLWRLDRGS